MKLSQAFLTSLLIIMPTLSYGTTVLLFVTREGIVIGADSKTTDSSGKSDIASKIDLVQNRFSVATVWLTSAKQDVENLDTGEKYKFDYNFESWMTLLKPRLNGNLNIQRFCDLISTESEKNFRNFDSLIKAGAFNFRAMEQPPVILTRYYVAGYGDNKIAHVFTIEYQIDFIRRKLIGPVVKLIHPQQGLDVDFGFNAGGTHNAIDQILKQKGEPYSEAKKTIPIPLNKLLTQQDLSLDDAVELAKAFIRIESKWSSEKVGPPIRVVVIPKNGNPAHLTVY